MCLIDFDGYNKIDTLYWWYLYTHENLKLNVFFENRKNIPTSFTDYVKIMPGINFFLPCRKLWSLSIISTDYGTLLLQFELQKWNCSLEFK